MTATAVAPPRRRVEKIDMNAYLRSVRASSLFLGPDEEVNDRWLLASIRRMFAAQRPAWGLGSQVEPLTWLSFPRAKKVNAKIAKNELPTLSLTMSSHAACHRTVNGRVQVLNTCAWAGACSAVCVLSHGRGKWDLVRAARNWRTSLLYDYPDEFLVLLRAEILRAARRTKGEPFLARLNVNSDLPWHLIPELFEGVPMQAYDYTKDPSVLEGDGWVLPNYRRIYSWNETSDPKKVAAFLKRGGSIAMVTNRVKGQRTHPTLCLQGSPRRTVVVDGDQTDNRYDTPPGVIVDLYAKGDARTRPSAFVQKIY